MTFCGAKFGFCILVHDVYPRSVSKRRRARLKGLVLAEDSDLPLLEATFLDTVPMNARLAPEFGDGREGRKLKVETIPP